MNILNGLHKEGGSAKVPAHLPQNPAGLRKLIREAVQKLKGAIIARKKDGS